MANSAHRLMDRNERRGEVVQRMVALRASMNVVPKPASAAPTMNVARLSI